MSVLLWDDRGGRLPLRDKIRILESIVEGGVGQLTFTGGEPLLDGECSL